MANIVAACHVAGIEEHGQEGQALHQFCPCHWAALRTPVRMRLRALRGVQHCHCMPGPDNNAVALV